MATTFENIQRAFGLAARAGVGCELTSQDCKEILEFVNKLVSKKNLPKTELKIVSVICTWCGLRFDKFGDEGKEEMINRMNDHALLCEKDPRIQEINALQQELAAARELLRWKPCAERMPEKRGLYEVLIDGELADHELFVPGVIDWAIDKNITHWREIPKL